MSQSLAAQELGISSRQIRNYFNGTHKPTRKNIEKIRALMDNRQNKQPSAQLEFLEG
jgi:transcriptional regulator with XRE-family HTH domain